MIEAKFLRTHHRFNNVLTSIQTSIDVKKLTNQWAKKLRDPAFSRQFVGLTLADFLTYDPLTGQGTGRIAEIHSPAPEVEIDFRAALRAVKKNLILMDEFVFAAERNKP